MSVIQFWNVANTIITFDPALDQIDLGALDASQLRIDQVNGDVVLTIGTASLTLSSITLAHLNDSNFSFASGVVSLGGVSGELQNGTAFNDYLSLGRGGNDTVYGGDGSDFIFGGSEVTTADAIDGGAGIDRLVLTGGVTLAAQAGFLTGVETVAVESSEAVSL